MRFRWRALLIGCLLLTLTLVFPPPAPTGAQTGNRVALVVRFDDETVVTRCVTFSEAQISGYEVLDRSGLKIVADFSGMGAAICKIEDTGCSDSNCFCKSPPDYWSYWHLDGEAWVYAQAGASGHQVSDGDVEGWSWGPAKPPPVIPFDEICTPPPHGYTNAHQHANRYTNPYAATDLCAAHGHPETLGTILGRCRNRRRRHLYHRALDHAADASRPPERAGRAGHGHPVGLPLCI